jgi:hypothetical protein
MAHRPDLGFHSQETQDISNQFHPDSSTIRPDNVIDIVREDNIDLSDLVPWPTFLGAPLSGTIQFINDVRPTDIIPSFDETLVSVRRTSCLQLMI